MVRIRSWTFHRRMVVCSAKDGGSGRFCGSFPRGPGTCEDEVGSDAVWGCFQILGTPGWNLCVLPLEKTTMIDVYIYNRITNRGTCHE